MFPEPDVIIQRKPSLYSANCDTTVDTVIYPVVLYKHEEKDQEFANDKYKSCYIKDVYRAYDNKLLGHLITVFYEDDHNKIISQCFANYYQILKEEYSFMMRILNEGITLQPTLFGLEIHDKDKTIYYKEKQKFVTLPIDNISEQQDFIFACQDWIGRELLKHEKYFVLYLLLPKFLS